MVDILKPTWWAPLSSFFTFTNDGSPTIADNVLIDTLKNEVEGSYGTMTSTGFQSLFAYIIKQTPSKINTSGEAIVSNTANGQLYLGYAGDDFIAGNDSDNILHGGLGNDYFSPGGGIDLVVGSDETESITENDTIAYLTAAGGIVINATVDTSSGGGSGLLPNQDVYTVTYADWENNVVPKISGFEVGENGDFVDFSQILAEVGYTGSDPVGDGYIRFGTVSNGMKIQFDPDGYAGSTSGHEIIRLIGITIPEFSVQHNLMLEPLPPVSGTPNYTTYVSNDGDGAYDILYSIENFIGSTHNDIIHGHTVNGNIISGAAGNDTIYGEGGANILIGGAGTDTVHGGNGIDLLLIGDGQDQVYGGGEADIFKFDGTIGGDIVENTADIWDFNAAEGDTIDLSEILDAIGFAGSDAFTSGFIQLVEVGSNTEIRIDADGSAGPGVAETLAVVHNTTAASLSGSIVTEAPKIIYVGILGQSNAEGLRVYGGDADSGLTRIESGLLNQTDYDQALALYRDSNGEVIVPAIGSTRANGDYGGKNSDSWWFPSTNSPGEILIRAVEILTVQIAQARAAGAVKPVIVWGQGEADTVSIGGKTTEAERLAAQEVYKNATLSIFDFIKSQVGDDVTFYIMETGRYSVQAAQNAGVSQGTINNTVNGLPYIQAAQEQMAQERSDVFLATKYTDLPLNYEYDPVGGATDYWHFHPETRELIGDRVADFIALSLGQDLVLDNPGDYPINLLTDLDLLDSPGMVVSGNINDNIVVGTKGADILSGGAGDDTLYGGQGFDTVIYNGAYANYTLTPGVYLTVTDNIGTDGTDTLMDIERIEFADGYYENGVFYSDSNTPPVAQDDELAGDQDTDIAGNVLLDNGNGVDSDPDSDPLSVVPGSFATTNGFVVLNTDGTFVYTPNAGYFGSDSFNYTLSDGQGGTDIGVVNLTINEVIPPNTPPVAQDDTFSGDQDIDITGNVLADNGNGVDSDPDSDPLFVTAAAFATANGFVTINTDGSFLYTPNAGYFGTDTFDYTLDDGNGGTDIGTVNLTIDQVIPNNPPVAQDDALSGDQDTDIAGNVLADNGNGVDSDPDSDPLSVVPGSFATAHGFVTLNTDGTFLYTPNAAYFGQDSFNYTLSDGQGGTDIGTVTLTINEVIIPPNNPPVAQDDAFTGDQDANIAGNVLADNGNGVDSDPDSDPLFVTAAAFATANGFVTINTDGSFLYTPNAAYFGQDSFNYTLSDGQGGTDIGTVTLTINEVIIPPNNPPVAQDDAFTGDQDANIAGNVLADNGNGVDSDPDSDPLFVTAASFSTAHGSVTLNTDGSFLYTPNAGYFGTDTFDYTLDDGNGGTDIGTVNLTINEIIIPPNNPPVAQDDAFTGDQDLDIAGNVLADNGNGVDSDPDSDPLFVTAAAFATANGFVTINTDGSFLYTPNAGYFGTDTFDYTLDDGNGGTDIGTVSLTINEVIIPPNNPPVAQDDAFTGDQDANIAGNVLADNGNGVDSDPDSDPLFVTAAAFATANGFVTINTDGSFLYTPNAGYFGTDTFDYTLDDGNGGTDIGTVSLTINEIVSNPDDTFVATLAAENFDGGPGNDTVDYRNSPDAVIVDLLNNTATGGFAAGDTFSSIENLYGSDVSYRRDTLKGDDGVNTIHGLAGDDYLYGNGGDDYMYGGEGKDYLSGDLGHDYMYGDNGDDTIKGREGNDHLFGGAGNDYLEGGAGNDFLHGGIGADLLKGSSGVDTFIFHAMNEAGDTIQDFNSSEKIDISDILSGIYDPLTDLITDFVQMTNSGADSILSIDISGTATSFVQLVTLQNFTASTDEQALVNNGTLIV